MNELTMVMLMNLTLVEMGTIWSVTTMKNRKDYAHEWVLSLAWSMPSCPAALVLASPQFACKFDTGIERTFGPGW
jgi:hypothetical protein